MEFVWIHFSVANFLWTLFSPWKRDVTRVGARGVHPVLFLQAMLLNIFTRIIGAIVKVILIITAVILEIFITLAGAFLFLIWLIAPLALLLSLGELIFYNTQNSFVLLFFWILVFLASLFILVISLKSFRAGEKDYLSMDLATLNREGWFSRVWNRVGVSRGEMNDNLLADQKQLTEYLKNLDITWEEFGKIVSWETARQIDREKKRRFWDRENLMSDVPIGKNWSYAYTVNLDKYAYDLSERDFSEYRNAELVGKERELNELQLILTRPSQNSAILIGEAGVGRDTIIHTLAKKIRKNEIGGILGVKRILEINLKEALSDIPAEQSEGILQLLFSEAAGAGNVILVIRDIHQFLGAGEHDISSIISDYLDYPNFQIIGTTTPGDLHTYVEKKDRVMKYCDKITIEEADKDQTLNVLLFKLVPTEKESVIITYQALREIIDLSDRYISDSPYPEKALDMLEEVILHWSNNPVSQFIDKEAVDAAVSSKIKVPLGEVTKNEGEKLMNLENILHQRVVGQNTAISQIAETVRRTRIGLVQRDKPLGSFLFLGPTGVGKTESAKALAEAYFGSEERMIRIDMSEFQSPDSIDRIIGSSESGHEGYLVSRVKETPHALLLLDEIEKAYPDILNLFLQILDEGHLTDALGKKISFRNLIIIATSNAASEVIKENIQSGLGDKEIQDKVLNYVIEKGIFKTEFLNRFEGVIFFHPLNPEEIEKVTSLLLEKYAFQIKKQENIDISFEEGVAQNIAQAAYDPVFGARAINRYIQDKVEDNLAKKIIAGEIKKGGAYTVTNEDMV
jgi:ATP-dependent Clp protease ATP-binding subunit ClpC